MFIAVDFRSSQVTPRRAGAPQPRRTTREATQSALKTPARPTMRQLPRGWLWQLETLT